MKIIGDSKTATKFYVRDSKGSIKWVPNLEIAKMYVSNPKYPDWYSKDIYATNEDIIRDKDGKVKLISEIKNPLPNIKTVNTALRDFKEQTETYIAKELQDFAKKYDYDSIISMISYNNSNVEQYKLDAEKAINYRDVIWEYHYNFINQLEKDIKEEKITTIDFTEYYKNYLKDFPLINN